MVFSGTSTSNTDAGVYDPCPAAGSGLVSSCVSTWARLQCAEAQGKGCTGGNVMGKVLLGINQDPAASDSNLLGQ